jgi:demethylmenaquinone methyltransferase/2-methoxy-6-polyprenyl-1,4-benzoquinol methylase
MPQNNNILPSREEKMGTVRSMFDSIAGNYEKLNTILTFGLDKNWRKKLLDHLGLKRGSLILDVGCGTGDLLRELKSSGLDSVGIDLSLNMIKENDNLGSIVQGIAENLPFKDNCFDGVVSGFSLRNFVSLDDFFKEAYRIIKPGGRLAVLDVSEPELPIVKTVHGIWFKKCVPTIGGLLSNKKAYSYLPASTAYLPDEEQLKTMLNDLGYLGVSHRKLFFGTVQILDATVPVFKR